MAVNDIELFLVNVYEVRFRVTDDTGTETATLQLAVFPLAVAVTTAVPPATAVTVPFESTVATDVLEDFQLTLLSVASEGLKVGISVSLLPLSNSRFVLFNEIELTGTTTEIVQIAVKPSRETEISAVPAPRAFTFP